MTLRRRTGEADEGWPLKLTVPEAAVEVRDEMRLPFDVGELQAPPAALLDLVRPIVRHSPITAVATLRTSRHVHRVLDATGRVGGFVSPTPRISRAMRGSRRSMWQSCGLSPNGSWTIAFIRSR
jgi:hypothetical protein